MTRCAQPLGRLSLAPNTTAARLFSLRTFQSSAAGFFIRFGAMRCSALATPLHLDLPKRQHRLIADVIEWGAHKWSQIDRPGRSAWPLAAPSSTRGSLRPATQVVAD